MLPRPQRDPMRHLPWLLGLTAKGLPSHACPERLDHLPQGCRAGLAKPSQARHPCGAQALNGAWPAAATS